ncbi:MAG: phosphotransferase [Methylobacteriaceae bacterium]|nr:phosphotransferase [Methylobacteriaceae bacterium]
MMLAPLSSDEVASVGSRLLGWRVVAAEPVRRGGNNRIFRLVGPGGPIALKYYPLQKDDPRDRLSQEFAALSFLSKNGIDEVPRPIARDDVRRCAAYAWIEGAPPAELGGEEIDALAAFFLKIQTLRDRPEAQRLADASASCFSPHMVAGQLEERLRRIREVAIRGSELAGFLDESLAPAAAAAVVRLKHECGRASLRFDEPLPRSLRALSPSDFGLHNTLRAPTGRLCFVDFEYFGWDDPAKAVADVMLHAGMALPEDLAHQYRARIEAGIARSDPRFAERLDLFFPAIALIWCLILLNEFLPERWARRALAGQTDGRAVVQARQLERARDLLRRYGS